MLVEKASLFKIVIQQITFLLDRYSFLLLIPLVVFFSFFRLGHQPVHQWDEARTGINAIEMLENGDYINLHFGGEPDKIRAKPPLVIWLVATGFKIFGPSTWSLRLHSAIATVFIFIFLFLLIRLYESGIFALACCLTLLSVRGIIGFHVGRTGDFDAVLLAFLLGGMYYFLKYIGPGDSRGGNESLTNGERKQWTNDAMNQWNPRWLYGAALFWGLAFLTKGPAMGVLFPGLFLFLIFTKQFQVLLKRREVYYALVLCLVFPIGWYLTVHFYGIQLEQPEVSGRNAFERMFLYDLVDRFTETEFEGKTETSDLLFFFRCLKENFAIWHYFFYTTIIGTIIYLIKPGRGVRGLFQNHLLLLSVCIWSTLGLFLSLVTTAKFWYLAPAIPFIAITLVYGMHWLQQRFSPLPYLFLAVWLLAMYFRYLGPKPQATAGSETPDFFTSLIDQHRDVLAQSDHIFVTPDLPAQRVLLQLYFINKQVTYLKSSKTLNPLQQNDILFIRNRDTLNLPSLNSFDRIGEDEHYMVLQKTVSLK